MSVSIGRPQALNRPLVEAYLTLSEIIGVLTEYNIVGHPNLSFTENALRQLG